MSACLLLSACQTKPLTVTTVPIERNIAKQTSPRPLQLSDPKFYVVTADNLEEFKKKYIEENKNFVFYVISPGSYKKLQKNQAELLRYITQQKSVIVYYESVLR